ncbi:uncharacterized protein LOC141650970 [Silene latifolia]|uniref:uncharacterized protein LOC141650970 n=1 Tax=Silene latifolia TaxID=37657 RepID=UPI003D770425
MNVRRKEFCGSRLWHLPGPQSWKILVWKILSNSLPVGGEFAKRQMTWNASCRLCHNSCDIIETVDHLFKDYDVTTRIWAGSPLGINTRHASNISAGDWIVNWLHGVEAKNETEKALDRGSSADHDNGSAELVLGMNMLREGNPVYVTGGMGSCTMVRLMVDASWKKSCEAAWGWIALDLVGHVICKGSGRGYSESPLQAEVLRVMKALKWACDCGFLHLEVSSDCLSLLTQWAGIGSRHHQIAGTLDDITYLSANFHYLC